MSLRAVFAALLVAPLAAAQEPSPAQRDRQRESIAAAEQTARRLTTSLRVLAYQKLPPTAEQATLDEVAAGLRRLGREDMTAVLAHLEKAVAAPDPATASAEQQQAYRKHRLIVGRLRSLLGRADAVNGLDEAGRKLADLARRQHDLYLGSSKSEKADDKDRRRGLDLTVEAADRQADLKTDLGVLAEQLLAMKLVLSPDQRDRLAAADPQAKVVALVGQMTEAQRLTTANLHRQAAEVQAAAARDLQALAAALVQPTDSAAALRTARERVEQARAVQATLRTDTAAEPDLGRAQGRGGRTTQQKRLEHNAALADRQSRLEFQTRDARKAVEAVSGELAAKLRPAEAEMKAAEEQLRQNRPTAADDPQQQATDRLVEVRDELDRQIAADRAANDPLAATKRAGEAVAALIKEQAAAREQAKKATTPGQQKAAAGAQQAVARKARAVQSGPLPKSTAARKALDEAVKSAGQAANDLDHGKSADAQQAAALKALEEAKAALDAHAAAVEKRQTEVAGLEAGLKAVGELADREGKLAAAAAAGKSGDPLAQEQAEVAEHTKAAAATVAGLSPEAGAALAQAAADEASAARELAAGKPQPAADKAKAAVEKLKAAQAELGRKLNQIDAKKAGDLDPAQAQAVADAARQIAKAIEQTDRATAASGRAAKPLSEALATLAAVQSEVAAAAVGDPKAPATDAAAALEAGKLAEAIAAQRTAAEKFGPGPTGDRQRTVLAATEQLLESSEATAAARAAVGQAAASVPGMATRPLQTAGQKLDDGIAAAAHGDPTAAGRAQAEAAALLRDTLAALNATAEAAGLSGSQPGEPQTAQAATPSDQPAQAADATGQPGEADGEKPTDQAGGEQEKNGAQANGAPRQTPGQGNKAQPQGRDQAGGGTFINLQKLDREKVQQAAEAAFPAVFRELIKQYHINVKKANPAPPAK